MIEYKLQDKGWSWAVGPSATLQIWDHVTLIGEVPIGFVTDLVTQRLRDAALQRRLATMVEGEALDTLMRELEPRRGADLLPELARLPLSPQGRGNPSGLRAARRAAKLTTKQLAEQAQVSPTWLRNIESGLGDPSAVVAERIARVLKLDPGDLFPSPTRGGGTER